MQNTKQIGFQAEEFVAQKLMRHGFSITERNYQKKFGEIDIIAHKEDLLVFVEVKMRADAKFDSTLLIVPSKQKKIIAVAKEFIAVHNIQDMVCRFDVAIVGLRGTDFELCYIPNAFMEGE
jgi:putative endonuclease